MKKSSSGVQNHKKSVGELEESRARILENSSLKLPPV
jgi:hypothetical protein